MAESQSTGIDVSKFLQQANKQWGDIAGKATQGGFTNPPDGSYVAQLSGASLEQSRSSNRLQIKWQFTLLEGDQAGTVKNDYQGLEGERSLEFLAWRLRDLGVDVNDVNLERLQDLLDDLVARDMVMKITLKTQKDSDFQNLRVQKLLPNYNTEDFQLPSTEAHSNNGSAPESAMSGEDENIELKPGMKITFADPKSGKDLTGILDSVDEEAETCVVRVGVKKHTVEFNSITSADDAVDA